MFICVYVYCVNILYASIFLSVFLYVYVCVLVCVSVRLLFVCACVCQGKVISLIITEHLLLGLLFARGGVGIVNQF